jgi:lysophospholipase L1-like esterase
MITYIPAHLGNITITATSDGLNTPFESNIFVSPYATSVGFIGDSITSRVANNGTGSFSTNKDAVTTAISKLGSGFAGINRGVSGSTTRSRISDGYVAPAITAFQNANVDVVSIMLGSNDANGNFQISSGEYKANLQIIIDALKA